jgi:orotate phosphoribosyltransferase
MNLEQIYRKADAYLEGHFLLSSKKHSKFYLQSAKVLEDPKTSKILANELAKIIKESNIKIDTICSPALGGVIAGYELASSLGVRFIFTERVNKTMTLRRGFKVNKDENILICEDIITTGGSALETSEILKKDGANIVAFAALANRGFCSRYGSNTKKSSTCKLPNDIPLFALGDFIFDLYNEEDCPMCANGSIAYKPGSRI